MNNRDYLLHYYQNACAQAGKASSHPFSFMHDVFTDLVALELQRDGVETAPVTFQSLDRVLQWIDDRNDCGDFMIPALARMLSEHRHTGRLPEDVALRIENALLNFHYWIDEPGEVHACFFTENHQILFHSAEYLVGRLFPDRVFTSNGKTGAWHKEHATVFARRWLDWRARLGFSEWLAQGYYMADITGLAGLMHYADEDDIRLRCKMIVDMLMFDMAVNGFYGNLPTSHGRVYAGPLLNPKQEECSSVMAYAWGEGNREGSLSSCTALLAMYGYTCPAAIRAVGQKKLPVMVNKERMSVNVCDAKYYGVDPAEFDNIMFFWGMQTYSDRLCIENSTKVFPAWNWMNNRIFAYRERYQLCDAAGVPCEDAPDYTSMTQVDIYTRKTPDYIVSCVQDFRPGRMGYQQHPWSASLGGGALIFTNNPASGDYMARPNKWAGNLCLPKVIAHENVLVCIYRILPDFVDYLCSHAYFPQHEFDEVVEKDGWVFGRRGSGYVAMRSLIAARWIAKDPGLFKTLYHDGWEAEFERAKPYEYMAQGHQNVWVFEFGSQAENGGFGQFMAGFANASLEGDSLRGAYRSPSQGLMTFGWKQDLTVDGKPIAVHNYPRYDNPFCQAEFNTRRLEIRCDGHTAILDHETLERTDQ